MAGPSGCFIVTPQAACFNRRNRPEARCVPQSVKIRRLHPCFRHHPVQRKNLLIHLNQSHVRERPALYHVVHSRTQRVAPLINLTADMGERFFIFQRPPQLCLSATLLAGQRLTACPPPGTSSHRNIWCVSRFEYTESDDLDKRECASYF